jgi:hypothetical protein
VRRRLFNLAAAVSLVLCVATAILWVRSYFVLDIVNRTTEVDAYAGQMSRTLSCNRGTFHYYHQYTTRAPRPATAVWPPGFTRRAHSASAAKMWPHVASAGRQRWGFAYLRREWGGLSREDVVGAAGTYLTVAGVEALVPAWFVALIFALAPTTWVVRAVRRRVRRAANCCPTCGYDCRATPRTCPECGTDLPSSNPATDDQREEPAGATR